MKRTNSIVQTPRIWLLVFLATQVGAAWADDVFWVGYQNGCMLAPPSSASFFHEDNWLGFVVPGGADTAILGSGQDAGSPGLPRTIHFGNACLDVANCSEVNRTGGTANTDRLVLENESWTFDFGNLCLSCGTCPAPLVGSYTVASEVVVGDIISETGLPGDATLALENGSMTSEFGRIGVRTGAAGTMIVAGTDSHWQVSVLAEIGGGHLGQTGTGSLEILNGGSVTVPPSGQALFIGTNGGSGAIQVDGSGSALNSTLIVDTGTVTVTDQGLIDAMLQGSQIAPDPSSVGSVTVSGAGSRWEQLTWITVGGTWHIPTDGDGTITVEAGGYVSCNEAVIGDGPDGTTSRGEAVVTGTGSVWNASQYIWVGSGWGGQNPGFLTAALGGSVVVGETVWVAPPGVLDVSDSGHMTVGTCATTVNPGEVRICVDGALYVDGTVTGNIDNRGSLSGSGTITGNVVTSGSASPGTSPGRLTIIGDYTQHADGVLNIEIGGVGAGDDFDQLDVSGSVVLDGSLIVTVVNGFAPSQNDVFPIVMSGSQSGSFASVDCPPGFECLIDDSAGNVTIQLQTVPIPAASTWGLVAFALLVFTSATILLGRRRFETQLSTSVPI